jgi:hypothetical protein
MCVYVCQVQSLAILCVYVYVYVCQVQSLQSLDIYVCMYVGCSRYSHWLKVERPGFESRHVQVLFCNVQTGSAGHPASCDGHRAPGLKRPECVTAYCLVLLDHSIDSHSSAVPTAARVHLLVVYDAITSSRTLCTAMPRLVLYETRRFASVFTRARHWTLP